MPKVFYTERDIENLAQRGLLHLELRAGEALTDLAYEKARRLGVQVVRAPADKPVAVTAPASAPPPVGAASPPAEMPPPPGEALAQRIRAAVLARLGERIDPDLLEVIIQRVLNSTGVH